MALPDLGVEWAGMPGCLGLSWGNRYTRLFRDILQGPCVVWFLLPFCSAFYVRQVNAVTVEGGGHGQEPGVPQSIC